MNGLSNQDWFARATVSARKSTNAWQASTSNSSNDVQQETPSLAVPPQVGNFDLPRITVTREDSILFEPNHFQLGQ